MKRLILAGLFLCCSLSRGEEGYHIFTDTQGRAITARILTFDVHKQIMLVQLESGKQGKIPLDQLSDADKEYVQTWNKSKDFMDERKFKISAKRKKYDNDEKSSRDYNSKREVDNMGYELEFENRSDTPFGEIKVEYCIFYEQEVAQGGNKCLQGVYCGKLDVDKMPARAKKELETKKVLIYKDELDADWYYGSGADNVQRGEVHGIWLRASIELPGGEKIIRDFCLPDSLANSRKWTTSSVNVGMNK